MQHQPTEARRIRRGHLALLQGGEDATAPTLDIERGVLSALVSASPEWERQLPPRSQIRDWYARWRRGERGSAEAQR
jgi:hypothetical protein